MAVHQTLILRTRGWLCRTSEVWPSGNYVYMYYRIGESEPAPNIMFFVLFVLFGVVVVNYNWWVE